MDNGEETARLLATLIRLQTGSQAAAIVEVDRSGFGPKRIGELLGTSAGTVGEALRRTKKAGKGKTRKAASK